MKSEVYFTPFGAKHFDDSILSRLEKMFDRSGAGSIIKEGDLVAVKAHFGEHGNVSFISPVYYRTIIDRIKMCGGNPFITDSNTLYVGERNNAVKHHNIAAKHGFTIETAGAPVIIADGLMGTDFVEVEINGKHIKKAKIASAVYWAPKMIVVSHCKGHMLTGFGGTLKNLGMGAACRAGKQEQHSGQVPKFISDKCTGCGECVEWCNFNAIEIKGNKAVNLPDKCAGCGECIAACRFDAIESNWDVDAGIMQEKMAEYAAASVKNKKRGVFYFNFVINVTPECDCAPSSDKYLVPDIGILGSFDPVALDAASVDLINKASVITGNVSDKESYELKHAEHDKFRMVHPKMDWRSQLKHAEELRMGTREYELIEV